LLDAELPELIRQKIRADKTVTALAAEIATRLWRVEESRSDFFEDTFVDELHPRLFERWIDRARYYTALLFSPSIGDTNFLRVPPPFSFVYYFIRPVRLLLRFGPRWLKRLVQPSARATN
jgi:hypothetical protein